jgi:hypothetical protein
MAALRRAPALWAISKAHLVIAKKPTDPAPVASGG